MQEEKKEINIIRAKSQVLLAVLRHSRGALGEESEQSLAP